MHHDMQQLRIGVPIGVPPRHDIQIVRGGSYCPKCGADNYWAFSFYEDDPTYCTHCEEYTSEVGYAAVDLLASGRVFGDDAMDGAVPLDERNRDLLYGYNDDGLLHNDWYL